MSQETKRLAYVLTVVARTQRAILMPCAEPGARPIAEAPLRAMRRQLHPLDVAITQEICSGVVYGQLTDAQLARLLPLLGQRHTQVGEATLRVLERELAPRARLTPLGAGGWTLTLGLAAPGGTWYDLSQGRLIAGTRAYFIQVAVASPVRSPAPWLLEPYAQTPSRALRPEQLTRSGRDTLLRELAQMGVPPGDVGQLAVRRGPPDGFSLRLTSLPETHEDGLQVHAELYARYPGAELRVGGRMDSGELEASVDDDEGMVERDIAVEEGARSVLRELGFRFDRNAGLFVAQRDAAIRALDPHAKVFPSAWEVDRTGAQVVFHRDLQLQAQVQMLPDTGMVDVRLNVQIVDEEAAVAALVDMRALLTWLQTGRRYVRLADGSFVAPSAKMRQNLRLVSHLGAEGDRALVSPLCIGLLRAIGAQDALAAADDATQAWLAELATTSAPPAVLPPRGLATVLRDYQRRGLDWLVMLHRHRLTGILADDMGLGKTLQTLALLMWVGESEGRKPSLVVAPTSVVTVWRDEAARFAPDFKLALWYGTPKARQQQAGLLADADLVVTSYGVLRRDAEMLAEVGFRYVILDEAQSAKNARSLNAHSVRRLRSERRLALSGTPLENRPDEIWSLFDFLAPGFLGTQRQFRQRYSVPISRGDQDALGLLRLRLQPLMLRRLKKEVALELPDKVESVVRCDMGLAQRALYDHIAGELRESIQVRIRKVGIERAHLDVLAALTRLRQICCDPSLLPNPEGAKVPPSAKLQLFEELMREALASDRCVIVFSQFVQMQRRLISIVQRLGVDPLWLHGGTRQRDRTVAAFQDPKGPRVIVVSLRAGGTGLTLTRADTVMHYDPWWNPAVERQATDRAHRLGQKQTVTVYKLVCANTIEERVLAMAHGKQALAESLLGSEGGAGAKHISAEEVLALLS